MKEINNINEYISAAKARSGVKSNRKLCALLGVSAMWITQIEKRHAFPSDDNMLKLAKLAGVDPLIALIDLNIMRSKGTTKKSYQRIAKGIKTTVKTLSIAGIMAIMPSAVQAAEHLQVLTLSADSLALASLFIITLGYG